MRQAKQHILRSRNDTIHLGLRLAKILLPGDICILCGPLGAGKTTLVQGIARGMGIKSTVNSPTFVVRKRYRILKSGTGLQGLNHVDAYRLRTLKELRGILDEDMTERTKDVWVVEWGKRFSKVFPKHRTWLVRLDITGENERVLTIEQSPNR